MKYNFPVSALTANVLPTPYHSLTRLIKKSRWELKDRQSGRWMCLLFCCVHCIAEPLLQWRRPVYLATLHIVLCAFCATSAVGVLESSMSVLAMTTSLSWVFFALALCTKCLKLLTHSAHLQLFSAYIVYFQCVQISVCGIHRWNTGHWPNSLFRGVALFIFLFSETDQKYVCACSSVKANWQW